MRLRQYEIVLFILTVFGGLCLSNLHSAKAMDSLDIPRILSSESLFFHEYGYRFSIDPNIDWYSRKSGFRGFAGSISSNRFYFDLDAKTFVAPVEYLRAAYQFKKRESFSENYHMHRLEITGYHNHIIAGVTGMTESQKEFTEIGIVTGYEMDPSHWVMCRFIWQDAFFNKKTSGTTEYLTQPFNIDVEGIWKTDHWTVLGHVDVGFKWSLLEESRVQEHSDTHGYGALRYRLNPKQSINVEYIYRKYFNRKSSLIMEPEQQRIEQHQIYVSHDYQLSDRIQTTYGVTWVDVSGSSFHESETMPVQTSMDPPSDIDSTGFTFQRLDLTSLAQVSWKCSETHSFLCRLHVGRVDSSADGVESLDTIDNQLAGKLTLEYSWNLNQRGQIDIGLTAKSDDKIGFGGGNIRVRF